MCGRTKDIKKHNCTNSKMVFVKEHHHSHQPSFLNCFDFLHRCVRKLLCNCSFICIDHCIDCIDV
jgi:hypothetical protein